MEETLRSIMGSGLPPFFKFEDTYSSIVFPQGYTVPNETTVTNKFNELLAAAGDNQKTSVLGDLEVGTANLYVDVSASSVGIGTSTPNATLEVVGNAHVSSNLEVGTANLFVDTDTGYVGIGTTVPTASLEVIGNTYVSSDLGVSDTFIVDTTKGCVGLGTTTPNASLEVQGNAYISSNLQVGSLFVDTTKGRVGIGTTTPKANLHVEGNVHITNGGRISNSAIRVHTGSATVNMGGTSGLSSSLYVNGNAYISSNLNVSNVLSVDTTTGNVGIGVSHPDTTLTVNHRIHRENHKHIFDLEHLKPEYLKTSPSEYRYVCMESNPSGILVTGAVQYTDTDIYEYNPSNGTSTLVKSLGLNTEFTMAVSENRQYYSSKPFFLGGLFNYQHLVVPMTALGRIFIVRNTREKPITNYVYAPYDDVTINVYLSKSINETPTSTYTLTKETVYTWVDNPNNEHHTLTVEAVDGVILMSRKGDGSTPTDSEVVFPASDLVYNLTRPDYLPGFYFHNIFNGDEGDGSQHALNAIVNGAAIYSPDGSMATVTHRGDGDGGEQNHPIPYEMLGDTYYAPNNISGYMIAATEHPQTITVEYTFGSTWTNHDTFNTQEGVTPTRPQYWARGNIGTSGSNFNIQANAWRFKSSHGKIYVRVESGFEDEYSLSGWLENTSTYNFYKLPTYGPSIYKCGLKTNVNINAGALDGDVIYAIFSSPDQDITPHYGAGYSKKSDDKHIYVPSAGTYRVSFVISQKRTDTASARTAVCIGLTVNGVVNNLMRTEHSYIRNYDGHLKSTSHFSEIVEINDTRLVGLFFKRRTTITNAVYVESFDSSFFMIEKVG